MLDKKLEILVLSWSPSPKSRFKHNLPKTKYPETHRLPLEIGHFFLPVSWRVFVPCSPPLNFPKKNPRTNPDPSRELRLERSQSANQAHPVCKCWGFWCHYQLCFRGQKKVVPKSRNRWSGLLERERERDREGKKKHFLICFHKMHKSISSGTLSFHRPHMFQTHHIFSPRGNKGNACSTV